MGVCHANYFTLDAKVQTVSLADAFLHKNCSESLRQSRTASAEGEGQTSDKHIARISSMVRGDRNKNQPSRTGIRLAAKAYGSLSGSGELRA